MVCVMTLIYYCTIIYRLSNSFFPPNL